MRRTLLLVGALTLLFLIGPGMAQREPAVPAVPAPPIPEIDREVAGKPAEPSAQPEKADWSQPRLAPVAAKADLVDEMIQVLQRTESVDAFFVTLALLEEMGTKARPAIPAILRHAERLGILKNHLTTRGRDSEHVDKVAQALEKIRAAKDQPTTARNAAWVPRRQPVYAEGEEQELARCLLTPKVGQREATVVLHYALADKIPDDTTLKRTRELLVPLRLQLDARFQDSPCRLVIVPVAESQKVWLDKAASGKRLSARELGRHFSADYVVEVERFTTAGAGEADETTQLEAAVTLTVHEVRGDDDHQVFAEVCRTTMGPFDAPKPLRSVIHAACQKLARDVAGRFSLSEPMQKMSWVP